MYLNPNKGIISDLFREMKLIWIPAGILAGEAGLYGKAQAVHLQAF